MEVELDLSVAYPAYSFDQTSRLVVLLALLDDILKLGSWLDAEGGLVDGLVACVQLGDNKMASRTKG
jgi:hypothetical protein